MFKLLILCVLAFINLHITMDAEEPLNGKVERFKQHLDEFNKEVDEALKVFHIPGAAIGIVVDGKMIIVKGYGYRNKDLKLKVTEETLFGIGSCTKAFTSFILCQLADEKLISLDDPVIKYIPEFRLWDQYATEHTTIRDLLTHRTGLSGHDFIAFNSHLSREDLIKRLRYLEPIDGFRQRYHYSNLMYAVAGHVIERVTGHAWEEAVKARIFKPLEMHHSNFSLQKSDSGNEFSQDYFYLDQEALFIPVPFHNITLIGPAIGINSSVSDMLKWVQLQLSDGPLLDKIHSKKTILQEMHTPQIVAIDPSLPPSALFNYGLGWRMGCYRDNTLVMHAGTRDGFQAQIALLPSEKIGVVILTNGALISNHRVSREKYFVSAISNIILDALLGCEKVNWTQKMAEIYEQTKLSVSVQSQEDTKQLIAISPVLHDYIGTYQHPGYYEQEIGYEFHREVRVRKIFYA